MHVTSGPASTLPSPGSEPSEIRAPIATGEPVNFEQDKFRVRLTGLPAEAPDYPVTTIAIECDSEPKQDTISCAMSGRG